MKKNYDRVDLVMPKGRKDAHCRPWRIFRSGSKYVGRSNRHIIDSIKWAQTSTIVYSIVETANVSKLKPYEYWRHMLSVMMVHMNDADSAYLVNLMPWSENLPDVCKKAP